MNAYAPSVLSFADADPLFVVHVQLGSAAAPPLYWNDPAQTWDAAFNAAVHATPLTRLSTDATSPLHPFQTFQAPAPVTAEKNVHSLIYKAGSTGGWIGVQTVDGIALRMYSGSLF